VEKPAQHEGSHRLFGATPPPAPTGRKRPSARASRSHPASPRGLQPLGLRPHPISRAPACGGGMVPPVAAPPPKLRAPAAVHHQSRKPAFKKRQATASALNNQPGVQRSPIPPAPSRWEGERVALCRQGCRPRGASLAFPAPLPGSVGSFQGHQGFASPRSSPVRCSGCALRSACGFRSSP